MACPPSELDCFAADPDLVASKGRAIRRGLCARICIGWPAVTLLGARICRRHLLVCPLSHLQRATATSGVATMTGQLHL